MRCDFITLYKKEYIDKFMKSSKQALGAPSGKKKAANPYILPDEQEYYQRYVKGRHRVYIPIITNYFSEFDSGHKDFVRSFVHLHQQGKIVKPKEVKKKSQSVLEESKVQGNQQSD